LFLPARGAAVRDLGGDVKGSVGFATAVAGGPQHHGAEGEVHVRGREMVVDIGGVHVESFVGSGLRRGRFGFGMMGYARNKQAGQDRGETIGRRRCNMG